MPWLTRTRRSVAVLPILVFVLGTVVAAASAAWLRARVVNNAEAAFERRVGLIEHDIRRRLSLAVYGLRGAAGAYASHPPFDHRSFSAYVASRDLPNEFPGVRGFGYAEPVAPGLADAYERNARANGSPDFRIWHFDAATTPSPAAPAGDRFVIRFLEPLARNAEAIGLDVGSEPRRRAGIERAVATGEPTLTQPVTLAQDERRSPGFLLFVPLFRPGSDATTPAQRRAALVGLLFAPLVASEVLAPVAATSADQFGFSLGLPTVGGPAAPIYSHGVVDLPTDSLGDATGAGRHHLERRIQLPGWQAQLAVRSSAAFDADYSTLPSWLVLLGGVFTSGFLAGLFYMQGSGQRRAESMAERMTAELARLAVVAERTSNAVVITDRALRITWVNDGFTRLYGHTMEQALGRTPGELLGTPDSNPQAIRTLAESAAAGTGCRVEVVNRTRDGRQLWLDTEVQPSLDESGRLVGFVEIASDITERHRAEQRVAELLRENQALLGTIRTHTILSVTDSAGTLVEVNDAFCTISGYRREELLGRSHAVIDSGIQDASFWQAMWATISSGKPWRGEICNRARDGSLYWVDSMIAPITGADGRIEKYVSIRSDISASKQAALELVNQRQRLADIIDGTEAGTWECDLGSDPAGELQQRNVRISVAYAAFSGRTVAECLAAMQPSFLALLHPADVAPTRAALDDHLQGRTPAYAAEYRVQHTGGRWVWIQSRGKVSERDLSGQPLRISGIVLDISVRKQAERDLSRQRQALANIIDGTHAATWEWDIGNGRIEFNARWMQLTGCSADELNSTMAHWAERIHPDDGERLRLAMARHFNGELPHLDCEYRMRHADGHWVWILSRSKVVGRNADGRARWVAGTHIDVTERKLSEARLAASQAFLDQTGRIAGVGGWQIDLATETVVWSDETARIHDLPPGHQPTLAEAYGHYPPAALDAIQQAVAHSSRSGAGFDLELPLTTASGRSIWVRAVGSVETADGKPVRLVGAFQDITARRVLEQEALRSERLLRAAIDAIDEAFVLYDPEDRLVFCNDKYRQIYNRSAEVIVPGARFEDIVRHGMRHGQMVLSGAQGEAWVEQRLRAHRAGETTPLQQLADGRSLRVVERRLPDGHIVGFRIDISEMVRATEAANAASQAKSQFLANMSHEIRTPMNAILGMLALLRKTDLNARQADYAGKTEGAARSLLLLLNDILDFSKIDAGKMALDPQPFRLETLLQDLSVILAANLGNKPVELLFDVDPAVPAWLLGDALRLQQVLINLAGNAVKFTAEGEVVVSVAVCGDAGATCTDEVMLEIAVRDTGIGIAPENQERIFSAFTQAESSTTRRFGGTGLGVVISQRLVMLMGGELGLQSTPGQGSRFHFRLRLPVAQAQPAARALPFAASPAPSPLHALVVDDNPTAREVLQRMAESLGWQVETAGGGEQALALMQAAETAGRPFEAVFVDWQMPGLDGWQTSHRIRQRQDAHGAVPTLVVMVTAHGRDMLAQRPADEQALLDGFLVKPVTAAMLAGALAEARLNQGVAAPASAAVHTAAGMLRHPHSAAPQRLAGLRVLLVEDNANNQQVARELLEDEGARVQVAADGALAVAAVAASVSTPVSSTGSGFDIVLMDLQMPVMDGYTATSEIRQALGLSPERLPIVAMTANAMASDREACLAAGMNDHVGKPFDIEVLVALLLRLSARSGAAAAAVPVSASASASVHPTLSHDVLAAAQAADVEIDAAVARLGGKPLMYRRMLGGFINDLDSSPARVQDCLDTDDAATAARLAHTLRGVAATLGASVLAREAGAVEATLRSALDAGGDPQLAPLLTAWITRLQAARKGLAALYAALETVLEPAPSQRPPAALDVATQRAELEADLQSLAELLRQSDLAALAANARLQARYAGTPGLALHALDEAIGGLDFSTALQQCRTLAETCHP